MNANILKMLILGSGHTKDDIAKALKITTGVLEDKLDNPITFKANEIYKLCDLLSITDNEDKKKIFLP